MAIKGWGTGAWGNFKWGGEEDVEAFTPTITGVTLTLTPSTGLVKRIRTVTSDLTLTLLPTFTYARGMRANVTLSLLPSYTGVVPTYTVNENGVSFGLLPYARSSRTMATTGVEFSLLPSSIVTANPTTGLTLALAPSYEGLANSSNVTSNLVLGLTSSYIGLVPDYKINVNNLIFTLIPNGIAIGWRCRERQTTRFSEVSRGTSSWSCTTRQTTQYSEVAR